MPARTRAAASHFKAYSGRILRSAGKQKKGLNRGDETPEHLLEKGVP